MTDFILASASPRRKNILKRLGFDFKVIPSDIKEGRTFLNSSEEYTKRQAYRKASEVRENYPGNPVVGADTVVVHEEEILGKPENEREAFNMLSSLSNSTHSVITGICLVSGDGQFKKIAETTVRFAKLSEREIEWYVNTGEPFDKAGGYGIQSKASLFVDEIHGCYFNVVGFPVRLFYRLLREINSQTLLP